MKVSPEIQEVYDIATDRHKNEKTTAAIIVGVTLMAVGFIPLFYIDPPGYMTPKTIGLVATTAISELTGGLLCMYASKIMPKKQQ